MIFNALVFLTTLIGMEGFAFVAHKYVMHGWGWGWHRSHHEPRTGWFEKNDLYAVVFALFAIVLIALGNQGVHPLEWIGAGMTAYGFLYFLAHDGLVHKRWPLRYVPRNGYLKRLYQAHRMHHAVPGKAGCVSFGFLYAPSISTLRRQLRALHGGPLEKRDGDAAKNQRVDPASGGHGT
ncbi:sterol desaturase family protein [Pseudomonas sp. SWRI18]|uniref:sterol desaturase family protein n=1 Tax=Pseudomonas sp. SWRI18 TaxID=2753888 RepID=UPI001646D4BD|nr:sterol desaturase family protein [Pseudomonas sp. SWRI18]MBC3303117.1 sterol desaturase family protein [Pseudomonas sp. SWRI18]